MTPVDPSMGRGASWRAWDWAGEIIVRKLAVIVENLQALESVVKLEPAEYRKDLFRRKGTERLLQELIEAALDVNAHLLVQQGHVPPDDYYRGFLMLADTGVLSHDLAGALAPAAGLRNRLVHEYGGIVDAIVLDAVRKAQNLFPQYVAAIEACLRPSA